MTEKKKQIEKKYEYILIVKCEECGRTTKLIGPCVKCGNLTFVRVYKVLEIE